MSGLARHETWCAALSGTLDSDARPSACNCNAVPVDAGRSPLEKALVRALLAVEWERGGFEDAGKIRYTWMACPSCYERKGTPHKPGCQLDAALTAAGLPDQATRDEARKAGK